MNRAVRYAERGSPSKVLLLEDQEVPRLRKGEVRIALKFATINPSDYGKIAGTYGQLPELPTTAGREGIGVVEAVGASVSDFAPGDLVRMPERFGVWQNYVCAPTSNLMKVPAGVPLEQAALSFLNPPTAHCLLTRFVALKPGDWVIQNAGNSAVGVCVIQMARAMGLRTISQVRRPELVAPLKALGADHVVVESEGWTQRISSLIGGAPILLGLNSIGGSSAVDQIKTLCDGATQVTFGGMVGDPIRFPTRSLIFHDVTLRGFWWDRFVRDAETSEIERIMAHVFKMMGQGNLRVPVAARYGLDQIFKAIEHDQSPRFGKVLLKPFQ